MQLNISIKQPNKSEEPINYPAGNSSAHFKRYLLEFKHVEQIYKQYYSRLFSFINSKVHNMEDAKDILSEVFIKIYTNIDKLNSDEKLTSWIFTITRNSIIDFYRKNAKNRDNIEFDEEYILKEKEQENAISELSDCIEPIINSLAPKYAQALYLSEIKELKITPQ